MPYRRLPNTDSSRLRALHILYSKGKELPPFKLGFSQNVYTRIQSFLPGFENAISQFRQAYAIQVKRGREYQNLMKKARMYISHFIQVVNMAISRGELPAQTRAYYGLEEHSSRLPSLVSEKDILKWGEAIIKGEQQRIMKGMAPVTNPTVAVVKVRFENFKEACQNQKVLQKNSERALEELSRMRKQADEIISQAWNEVEESFAGLPDEVRRSRASEYGVVYVYRKYELPGLSVFDRIQVSAG